jgi:RimJ/RimL family protein N-acetyltransferase
MTLETSRLFIRPFRRDDLRIIHGILDQAFGDRTKVNDEAALSERRSWLEWSILNQEWFEKLHQPPYGERAVILKSSGEVIGSVGYVPLLIPFDAIPELRGPSEPSRYYAPEFGLFWVIDPKYRGQGYATEAARAMVESAFEQLRVKRVRAVTEHTNLPSQRVMRKTGMRIIRNPLPEPSWLQVVGVLENPK